MISMTHGLDNWWRRGTQPRTLRGFLLSGRYCLPSTPDKVGQLGRCGHGVEYRWHSR